MKMDIDLNLHQSSTILEESNENETIDDVRVCRKLPTALLNEVRTLLINFQLFFLVKIFNLRFNIKWIPLVGILHWLFIEWHASFSWSVMKFDCVFWGFNDDWLRVVWLELEEEFSEDIFKDFRYNFTGFIFENYWEVFFHFIFCKIFSLKSEIFLKNLKFPSKIWNFFKKIEIFLKNLKKTRKTTKFRQKT